MQDRLNVCCLSYNCPIAKFMFIIYVTDRSAVSNQIVTSSKSSRKQYLKLRIHLVVNGCVFKKGEIEQMTIRLK